MKETLETINRMQAEGVIGRYAIGGAVGATLYLDPVATLDVDVFVTLPGTAASQLVSLTPIYEYLTKSGYDSRTFGCDRVANGKSEGPRENPALYGAECDRFK